MTPAPAPGYAHYARYVSNHDGDTAILVVDFGTLTHGVTLELPLTVRLADIDTWELGQAKGAAARDFTHAALAGATTLVLETFKAQDKYGRVLARVWFDGRYLPDELRAAGFAKVKPA